MSAPVGPGARRIFERLIVILTLAAGVWFLLALCAKILIRVW